MSSDEFLTELLAKPVPTYQPKGKKVEFTQRVQFDGADAVIEMTADRVLDESASRQVLLDQGEDPDLWVATKFESSSRELSDGKVLVSNKFAFSKKGTRQAQLALQARAPEQELNLDDILERVEGVTSEPPAEGGPLGFIVALGDMQFGKIDGDGVEGTLRRTFETIDRSRENLPAGVGHVHVAFLGDHIEGMVSQGGANVWRTPLTLNEQVRLTRRTMLHALEVFGDAAPKVSLAAVPGNHGEPQRFHGKGVTRYDDSHDTESLIAVADIVRSTGTYQHVDFLVPDTDEMTIVHEVAGTNIGHAHGHQWKPNQHMKWWEGQSFGGSPLGEADVLLAGHLHHLKVEANGPRLFVQVQALESESTWWRHSTGQYGDPGLVNLIVQDGKVHRLEVVR